MKVSLKFSDRGLESLLIVFIFLAILLRILNLGARELWYDEVLSLLLSTGQKIHYQTPGTTPVALADYAALLRLPTEASLGQGLATLKNVLRGVVGGEPHPPLFFLTQHVWFRLHGATEASLRSLGVLISAAAMGGSYGLGRLLMRHRGGLILAALLALNPFYLFHSLNLRMYGPIVLWVILSAWAMLHLALSKDSQDWREKGLWNGLLIGSIAAGLLTFYLFVHWLVVLTVLALYLDRHRWRQHALRIGAGVLLALPWFLWGLPQQLNNADLDRFSAASHWFSTLSQHFQNTFTTLGVHLLFGDWGGTVPASLLVVAGIGAVALVGAMSARLVKQGKASLLVIALIMGLFPLLMALGADILTGKFTFAWGLGRVVIFTLPGNLLLLTVCLENLANPWRKGAVVSLLALYLVIGMGDFSFRGRQMFHTVNDWVMQAPETRTLLVMNSKAWGNVLRLAYYIDPEANVDLLAAHPADLADSLRQTLRDRPSDYQRVLWLHAARSVWKEPETEEEARQIEQAVGEVLQGDHQLVREDSLSGTMTLDQFSLNLYEPALVGLSEEGNRT
ncbi:MAG: glycosyltransferase family 39 protein [Leptolyngbyaceae cyanobacterium MO_188.B28]|nr:glycosyltransferase family 39 protein [Leptolyngbyaceae cyanobacterium MO_188.B28]